MHSACSKVRNMAEPLELCSATTNCVHPHLTPGGKQQLMWTPLQFQMLRPQQGAGHQLQLQVVLSEHQDFLQCMQGCATGSAVAGATQQP
jgi:hypothetical protein